MIAIVLVTGSLQRNAEQKTSANGKPYTTANVRVKSGDSQQFFRVMAFDPDLQTALLDMKSDDGISVTGRLSAELYTSKDNQPRLSLSVMADQVLPLKRKPFNPDKQSSGAPSWEA
jgi:hypothetical protein